MSKLTFADIERFLALPAEEELYPYLDAAAVLAAFDPVELRPLGGEAVGSPGAFLERLLAHCDAIVQGPHRGHFSLTLADRRAALKRLGTRERMRDALKVNPNRLASPTQMMFERVLEKAPVDPQRLARDDLVALIDVGRFVRGILDGVPDEESLLAVLARQDVLAPMHRLVEGFVNRREELWRLEGYVDGPQYKAPLFVFGVGGVGKSTLIARFLLDHVGRGGACAYLDIDRPTIRPGTPETLVLETISQLVAQLQLPDWAAGAASRIAELGRRMDQTRGFESNPSGSGALDVLRDILNDAAVPQRLAVVVDTFEEAQFLGSDVVAPLSKFLMDLAEVHPSVRVVVSGRGFPPEFADAAFPSVFDNRAERVSEEPLALEEIPLPVRPINLSELDLDSARSLLDDAVEEAGMPKLAADDRDAIIEIVSRNPMCLKLAARLLRNEGVAKLREARSEVLALLKAEKVQALLYGRILTHLHAEDVKRIAYPGLIVRRITPEVIREVLAGPCELKLSPERSEHAIYRELTREAALVERDPSDGSLRHRTDVRRAMLEDLTDHVKPELIEQIDRAAVAFYESQDGPVARAEELYHRMRLREPDLQLDGRWMPEAVRWLKNVGDEVAPQQRLWLASKLGATLDPAVRREASQQAWEEEARLSAVRYIGAGFAGDALTVLHERVERLPRSPLYTLEADAYRLLGRKNDALRVARAGVDSASAAGAIDLALELVLTMVVIEEGDRRYKAAARLADEAAAIATHSANDLLKLRTLVTRLRLDRRLHPESHGRRDEVLRTALDMLTPETLRELRRSPVLLREVAAELGNFHGPLTAAAIETLGIEVESDEQARALGRAMTTATEGERAVSSPVVRDAVKAFEGADFDPDTVREHARWVSGRDTREISGALAGAEPGAQALQDFGEYFRLGVDSALQIQRIVLRQVDDDKFSLEEPLVVTWPRSPEGATLVIEPEWLSRTDLASIPGVLGWFARRHGRHTAASLVHDLLVVSEGSSLPADVPEEWRLGPEQADVLFREMLLASGVPPARSYVMWAAVAARTRWHSGLRRRATLVAWGACAAVGTVALVMGVAGGNWALVAAALVAPAVAAALWGGQYPAGVVAGYAAWWAVAGSAPAWVAFKLYQGVEGAVWIVQWLRKRFGGMEAKELSPPTRHDER